MSATNIPAELLDDAQCSGCGCTDSHACEGGCHWVRVARNLGVGICSQCAVQDPALVKAWDGTESVAEELNTPEDRP